MNLQIPMIGSEKSQQNLSDFNKFLFKIRFEVNKNQIFSSEKMINPQDFEVPRKSSN